MKYSVTSLLAAYAFAQEDTEFWNTGVSRWNAVDGAVIDDVADLAGGYGTGMKLSFNYYVGAKESPEELHGDFKLYFNGYEMDPNIEYGFCMQIVADTPEKYDCMRVRTNIDVEALATEVDDLSYNTVQEFEIVDLYSRSDQLPADQGHFVYQFAGFMLKDDDWEEQEAQEKNWRLSASKSFKMGCKAGETEGKVVCDWINAHWFRNFSTSQPDQDTQIAGRPEDTEYTAYGWIASYPGAFPDDTNPENVVAGTPDSAGYTIKPNLTQAKRNALTEEQKQEIQDWEATLNSRTGEPVPVDEPETDDEEETNEEGDGTDETDENAEDSDADAVDSDADAEDSDAEEGGDDEEDDDEEEGGDVTEGEEDEDDGAAELVTYTAAIVTAFGALLI